MKPYTLYKDDGRGNITYEERLDRIISNKGVFVEDHWTGEHPHRYNKFVGHYNVVPDRSYPPTYMSSRWMTQVTLDKGDRIPDWDFEPNKHRLKVQSVSVDLAELIATRKETISMVSRTTMRLAQSAMDVRRGRFSRAASRLGIRKPSGLKDNNFPGNWLAYQYGWAPLLDDIHTVLTEEVIRELPSVPVYTTQYVDRSYTRYMWVGDQYVRCVFTERATKRQVTRIKAKVSDLSAFAQLGLTNPALLAWNLLPYSFVVDWFIPVGNMLEAMSTTHGVDIISSSTTDTVLSHKQYVGFYGDYGNMKATTITKSKTRSLGFPAVELPRFQNPLSLQHFANGMALLTEAFRRKA